MKGKFFLNFAFVANVTIWVIFGVISFFCAPHWQDNGYYADDVDFYAAQVTYENAPESLKPVIRMTDPVMYLIEPFEEGEPAWENTLTMLGAFFALLFYIALHISDDKDKDKEPSWVLVAFDVVLLIYLLLCFAVVAGGIWIEIASLP